MYDYPINKKSILLIYQNLPLSNISKMSLNSTIDFHLKLLKQLVSNAKTSHSDNTIVSNDEQKCNHVFRTVLVPWLVKVFSGYGVWHSLNVNGIAFWDRQVVNPNSPPDLWDLPQFGCMHAMFPPFCSYNSDFPCVVEIDRIDNCFTNLMDVVLHFRRGLLSSTKNARKRRAKRAKKTTNHPERNSVSRDELYLHTLWNQPLRRLVRKIEDDEHLQFLYKNS